MTQYNIDALIEMIPPYINGSISHKDKLVFEDALKNDTKLLKEYNLFVTLDKQYKQIPPLTESDSNNLFKRIEQNIGLNVDRNIDYNSAYQKNNVQLKKTNKTPLLEFIKDWLLAPQLAWGITALLTVFVVGYTIEKPSIENNVRYQTLSQKSGAVNDTGELIQIIFKKTSTYESITELLRQTNAEVVLGPKKNGVLILKVKDSRVALITLRKSPDVLFVEQSME